MKRFLKVFLPLLGIALGCLLLCFLERLWIGGAEWADVPRFKKLFFCVILGAMIIAPDICLTRFVGHYKVFSILPLIFVWLYGMMIIGGAPAPMLFYLFGVMILMVAASALWALYEQKKIMQKKEDNETKWAKEIKQRLQRFKTDFNRQYFVISHMKDKCLLSTLQSFGESESDDEEFSPPKFDDDDYLILKLPEGRHFVILRKRLNEKVFQNLLDDFRKEAKADADVLGYIDQSRREDCRMMTADSTGGHNIFTSENPSYLPFDFAQLDKAKPILFLGLILFIDYL